LWINNFALKHEWEGVPARIVSDAAVMTAGVADGKLVPLVIIDASERPDLEELVRVQQHITTGDVGVQWGRRKGAEKEHCGVDPQILSTIRT